jgi:hypothetical protein
MTLARIGIRARQCGLEVGPTTRTLAWFMFVVAPGRLLRIDSARFLFLAKKGHSPEVVNRMYNAWWKSMILQVTLSGQPYIRQGDF